MATYTQRGYRKPKEKIETETTNEVEGYVEGESTTEDVFNSLDESASQRPPTALTTHSRMRIVAGWRRPSADHTSG